MKSRFLCAAFLAAVPFYISPLRAEADHCETETIITAAEVRTSYGASYSVETYYRSPMETAARFLTEAPALMAVDGPFVWTSTAEGAALGGENERRFVIGHQFHALAFWFDTIMTDIVEADAIPFNGAAHHGRTGVYPQGGGAALVLDEQNRPLGLVLTLPGETPIEVAYDDWRDTGSGREAPYAATITHKGNVYSYRFSDVTFGMGGRDAFYERYPAPPIGAVAEFRATGEQCGASNSE